MNNLNSVIIDVNLTENLVLSKSARGNPVCNFTIVSTRYYKNETGFEKEEGYFSIQVYGKLAELAVTLGRQGRGVRVVGRLKQERRNSPNGQPQTRIVIIAEHVEFRPESEPSQKEAESNEQA
jgi:single-strand DNA-binding protein